MSPSERVHRWMHVWAFDHIHTYAALLSLWGLYYALTRRLSDSVVMTMAGLVGGIVTGTGAIHGFKYAAKLKSNGQVTSPGE